MTEMLPPASFDQRQALAEGWGIFECGQREDGTPRVEIGRSEDAAIFAAIPRQGSKLHRMALAMIDDRERRVIEHLCGPW